MKRTRTVPVISMLVLMLILVFLSIDEPSDQQGERNANINTVAIDSALHHEIARPPEVPGFGIPKPATNLRQVESGLPTPESQKADNDSLIAMIHDSYDLPVDIALASLEPLLAHPLPAVRMAAYEALVDLTHPSRVLLLSMARDDAQGDIRVLALEGLAMTPSYDALAAIEYGLTDNNLQVRLAAIDALIEFNAPMVVHSLSAMLYDPELIVRRQAVAALGEIGGDEAAAYLAQARHDPDRNTREIAESILAELDLESASR